MAAHDGSRSRLTRRGFLGGIAGSAAAAILAACGGAAGTTPAAPTTAPTTSAATTAPTAAAATRPAGSATTGAAATTAPATTTAGGSAAAGTTAAGTTTAGPIGTIAPPSPDKFRGQKLLMISRQEYFAETSKALDNELANWSKLTNTTVENNRVNLDQGDFVSKQQAAVQSGNVEDMMYLDRNVSQMQQLGIITDVSDVVNEMIAAYGAVEDATKNAVFIDGKWWAIPYFANSGGWFIRKDWADEKGIKLDSIKTYEQVRDFALEISDPSKNRYGWGLTVNKSGDGNGLILNTIQAYGGAVRTDDGKKVTFNSPETVAAVQFLADIYTNAKYKNMLPPGVNGWTDPSNNEAWLAGTIGVTSNAYTLYAKSFLDKNPVYDKTAVVRGFVGPGTENVLITGGWGAFVIFKGAKNPDLAKATAKYLAGGTPLLSVAKPSLGLILPTYKKQWDADPFYTSGDPSFPALKANIQQPLPIKSKTGFSFPQTPSPGQDQAVNGQYVLTDMMGDIIQKGVKVADAVKTAHDRFVQTFEQLGIKQ